MSNDKILSIDLGTSFIKGFLVDNNLSIRTEHSFEIKTSYNKRESVQDPHTILSAVKQILEAEKTNVENIIFTNAMHSTLLLDKNMMPLTKLIIWSDMRASDIYSEFIQEIDPYSFYKITQVPLHPILPVLKLFWIRKYMRGIWNEAKYIVSLKDWILYKLTGHLVTDISTAASTGLMNFSMCEWDNELLEICQIRTSQLPEIKEAEFVIKRGSSSLLIGNTDGPMANYFVNTIQNFEKNIVVTAGTSSAARVLVKSPVYENPDSGIFTYQIKESLYASGIASNNAGSVLKWALNNLNFDYIHGPDEQQPNVDDPLFNPFIFEERAPLWKKEVSSAGFSKNHTPLESDRTTLLVYESIFFNIRRMVDSLSHLSGKSEVIVSGGIFQNINTIQLFSNVIQKRAIALDSSQFSALGSAKFGLEHFGHTFENTKLNSEIFYPAESWKKVESQRFLLFKELIK